MKEFLKDREWISIIPIIFIVAFIPLIVHMAIVSLDKSIADYWVTQNNIDYFSFHKMIWLVISSIILLIMMGYKAYKGRAESNSKKIFYILIRIYLLFVLLSTLLSKDMAIVLLGFPDRYEGILALFSYMIVLIAAMNLLKNEKHIKIVLGFLFGSAVVISLIGLLQYIGHDLYQIKLVKYLVLPRYMYDTIGKISIEHNGTGVFSTLYHYNYVGSYMAMLLPLALSITVLLKNGRYKFGMMIVTLIIATTWLVCNSRAGILGGLSGLIVFLIMINNRIIKNFKYIVGISAIGIVLVIALNGFSNGHLVKRVGSIFGDARNVFSDNIKNKNEVLLKDIILTKGEASIITNTETLKVFVREDNLIGLRDKSDKELGLTLNNDRTEGEIADDKYKDYIIYFGKTYEGYNAICIMKNKLTLYFSNINGELKLVDFKGKVIEPKKVEKWGFDGKEAVGSGRGFVWSRSIPLLKETLLIGYGPDAFGAHFPQYDYEGKMRAFSGDMLVIVDKPHDLYLQIALNTGIISLIAVVALFIIYIIQSFKIYYRNNFNNFLSIAGVSILTAVCGYLVAGIFNDSVVSVAPVFWTLLGMGICINRLASGKEQEDLSATI